MCTPFLDPADPGSLKDLQCVDPMNLQSLSRVRSVVSTTSITNPQPDECLVVEGLWPKWCFRPNALASVKEP